MSQAKGHPLGGMGSIPTFEDFERETTHPHKLQFAPDADAVFCVVCGLTMDGEEVCRIHGPSLKLDDISASLGPCPGDAVDNIEQPETD